jgi:hypothetical protein
MIRSTKGYARIKIRPVENKTDGCDFFNRRSNMGRLFYDGWLQLHLAQLERSLKAG